MRASLTTVLDLVGLLMLVAALALWVGFLEPNGWVRGLAVAGAGLLLVSWITDGAPRPWRKGRL